MTSVGGPTVREGLKEEAAVARRTVRRSDRLGVRASPEQADLIREAAALEGKTVSAFMMDTVTSRARR